MVTTSDFVEAYETTKVVPAAGFTLWPNSDGGFSGCALGALLALNGVRCKVTLGEMQDFLEELTGLNPLELSAFAFGFDAAYAGVLPPRPADSYHPQYIKGYEVGVAIRKRFSPETVVEALVEEEKELVLA